MPKTMCAQCGSPRVHRSHHRHPLERIVTILGGGVSRCHNCNSRFVRFGGSLLHITDLRRASRRLALAVAMVVAAALVMVTILWFSRAQSSPSSDAERIRTGELTRMA